MAAEASERESFDCFVTPHLRSMWLLATRLVGAEAREDVMQEALLVAWRRFGTFDAARGSPRTWLLLLVADRSRKHWRAYRRTLELVDTASAEDLDGHLDLSRAVAALPRRQRMAVELHYVLGLPVAECAAVMGCAVGTVTSTLSDARGSLRQRLEVTS